MSGLVNSDEEVIDALDKRLEPSFNSDIATKNYRCISILSF